MVLRLTEGKRERQNGGSVKRMDGYRRAGDSWMTGGRTAPSQASDKGLAMAATSVSSWLNLTILLMVVILLADAARLFIG